MNEGRQTIVFTYNTAAYLIRFRSELIAELQRRGFICHAVLPRSTSIEERHALDAMNLTIHYLSHFVDQRVTPLSDLRLLLEYYEIFRAVAPRFVFNFTIKPVIYSGIAARLARVEKIAAMVTGLGYIFIGDSLKKRIMSSLARQMYRISLFGTSTVFFQNPDDLEYFVQHRLTKRDRSLLIDGSGVDIEAFQPCPRDFDLPVYLMVARLLRDKGVLEYLQASKLTKEVIPSATFLLVGPLDSNPSGLRLEDLRPFIEAGIVDYKGYLAEPLAAYQQATVYVLPSYREGRPRTVLEAMACGLPIVTTNVPGCKETVTDHVNGYLVPARSARELSEKMIALGKSPDLARKMGERSRSIAVKQYDVRRIAARICDALL